MGGQTQEIISENLLTPEALIDFVEELRHAGFNIGMAEYIAAQDLLLMLTSRGENFDDPQRVSSLFGPLLCSSPAEQDTFPEFFRRWCERQKAKLGARDIPHEKTMAETLEDTAKRGLRWEWILFVLGVAVLIFAAWFVSRNFVQTEISPYAPPDGISESTTSDALPFIQLAFVALGLLGVAYFAWWAWWLRTANQFLHKRQSQESSDIMRVSLAASDEALFPSLTFLSLARLFRQRVHVVSKDLNVVATVENSVEKGGWLNPVYDQILIPPEYLVLVDRRSRFDHLAEFVDGMVKRLKEHGVFITAYSFDGDPRLCFPLRGNDTPQSLNELAAHYENMRLIVFTEAQWLLSPTSGRLASWSRLFNHWVHRSVLTPEFPDNWGVAEHELKREFTVLPGTTDGLATFMHIIQGQKKLGEINTWADSALPQTIQERPQRWLEKDAPTASQIDSFLNDLKLYLEENGYTWLKACAVYPELQWQITITLGQLLKGKEGNPLLNSKRLIDLARLPWFRYGTMPDWLRTRLVLDLEADQEKEIRAVLEALLVTAVQGHGESLDLEVAYEQRAWTSRLARPLLRLLQRKSAAESPIRDHVYLDFMLQRLNLAVRVPENFRRQLFTHVGDEIGWRILLRWMVANILAMIPYMTVRFLSEQVGLDVISELLISLLIGPFVGVAQWLVIKRYWNIKALSWLITVFLGLGMSSFLLINFEVADMGGLHYYGTELGLTNLAVMGLLQAWLLSRHQVQSIALWWIGSLSVGAVNTLLSFLIIKGSSVASSNSIDISYTDPAYVIFILVAILIYGLVSGWILVYSLRYRKLPMSAMIRPNWIILNMVGLVIGAILGIVSVAAYNFFYPYFDTLIEEIVISFIIAIFYLPIPLLQSYFFRLYQVSKPRLWFLSSLLVPTFNFFIILLSSRFWDISGAISSEVLFLGMIGVLIGMTTGLVQGLVWRKMGLPPYYRLVWLLLSVIGWSLALIGSTQAFNFYPQTWDQLVVLVLTFIVLPFGIVTSLPLPVFLRDILLQHQVAKERLNKI